MGACCQSTQQLTTNPGSTSEIQPNEAGTDTPAPSSSTSNDIARQKTNSIVGKLFNKAISQNDQSSTKKKTNYYIQVVIIYHKQKKIDGEFIDFDDNKFTRYDGQSCKLTDDPNSLIPPFEKRTLGEWKWLEKKWKESKFEKINRNLQEKKYTRVAIFERDFGADVKYYSIQYCFFVLRIFAYKYKYILYIYRDLYKKKLQN